MSRAKTEKDVSFYIDNGCVTSEMFVYGEQKCAGNQRSLRLDVYHFFRGSNMNLHAAVERNKLPSPRRGSRSSRFCICWRHASRKGLWEILRQFIISERDRLFVRRVELFMVRCFSSFERSIWCHLYKCVQIIQREKLFLSFGYISIFNSLTFTFIFYIFSCVIAIYIKDIILI